MFLSTQLRPIEEAQKVRDVVLKGAPKTTYVVDEPSPFTVRMKAETEAGKRTVSVVGALHGELQPLAPMGALDAIDDVAAKLASRGIPGRPDGARQARHRQAAVHPLDAGDLRHGRQQEARCPSCPPART